MLAAWAREFRTQGYGPDELTAASRWLAVNDPPQYRERHLYALVGRVRDERVRLAGPPPRPDEAAFRTCPDCRGAGWAVVPQHPMPPGRWYTQAVVCACGMGRWLAEACRHRSPLGLQEYEAANPDWREQAAQHDRERLRLIDRAVEAAYLDRLLGAVRRNEHARAAAPARRLEHRQPHLPDEPL